MNADDSDEAPDGGLFHRISRFLRAKRWIAVVAVVSVVAAWLIWAPAGGGAAHIIFEGDSLHGSGKHREALAKYAAALNQATVQERFAILERMVRCAQEAGDEQATIDAALKMLFFDQDAWFGEYNLKVAEAVSERKVSIQAEPELRRLKAISADELALERFRLAAAGPFYSPEKRQEAHSELEKFARSVGKASEKSFDEIFKGERPPTGSFEELFEQSGDESRSASERAWKAFGAAQATESSGSDQEKLAAYRRAFDRLRAIQPVYFGAVDRVDPLRPRSMGSEPQLQQLLRHSAGKIRQLDSSASDVLRGGLRFRITGLELIPEWGSSLSISLSSPPESEAETGSPNGQPAPRPAMIALVPMQMDQTAWLGAVDGRYKLTVTAGQNPRPLDDPLATRIRESSKLLEFDLDALPAEVEIAGETVDLPPIRASLLKMINIIEPLDAATVDFTTAAFRWNPVPAARHYEITLRAHVRSAGGVFLKPFRIETKGDAPALGVDDYPADLAAILREQPPGSTGTWEIRAFDAEGKVIGKTPEQQRFVVGPTGVRK